MVVTVKEDRVYKRVGNDIYITMPITYTKAVLGGDIEVPLVIPGEKEKYKIKEGTKNGAKYKIKGKGFKHPNSSISGDLYFVTEVDVPTSLTKKQRELLEELSKTFNEELPPKKKGFFEGIF